MKKLLGFAACVATVAVLNGCCDKSKCGAKTECDPDKAECSVVAEEAVNADASDDDDAEVEEEAAE
jgi:predicted component of type VI protein secretion system